MEFFLTAVSIKVGATFDIDFWYLGIVSNPPLSLARVFGIADATSQRSTDDPLYFDPFIPYALQGKKRASILDLRTPIIHICSQDK